MYIKSKPIVEAELEPIDIAIRRERARLWNEEETTGNEPQAHYLDYLCREKARGVEHIVINF